MAIISTYPVDNSPNNGDYLVGTKVSTAGTQINPTKNFTKVVYAIYFHNFYENTRTNTFTVKQRLLDESL